MATVSKAEEAQKLVKKANKYISPSFLDFRLKPDWEAAAPLLDKACLLFKQAGEVDKALETMEKAALAQDRIKSPWHAAKHMEAAADLCKQHRRWEKVVEYYKQAAEYYISANKATIGADALARGARAVEEWDIEAAMTLLYDAVDIYESDTKEANAAEVFRLIIACAIKGKRYGEAVDLLMRFGSYCERQELKNTQCKCYLGAVVTHLYAKQPKEAWMLFQDVMGVDAFTSSEEAFAADTLFNAYRTGDEGLVQQVVKGKAVFKQLDNQVARLALKLPQGRMEKMARRLKRAMGPDEDGDEGAGEDYDGEGNPDEELL